MATSMELWGTCAYEKGWVPQCRYCFTEVFLSWSAILVWVWIQHLFLSILLTSKGFTIKFSTISSMAALTSDNKGKEIDKAPIYFFLVLLA